MNALRGGVAVILISALASCGYAPTDRLKAAVSGGISYLTSLNKLGAELLKRDAAEKPAP